MHCNISQARTVRVREWYGRRDRVNDLPVRARDVARVGDMGVGVDDAILNDKIGRRIESFSKDVA